LFRLGGCKLKYPQTIGNTVKTLKPMKTRALSNPGPPCSQCRGEAVAKRSMPGNTAQQPEEEHKEAGQKS